ncbi:hypothetical protein L3Y34_005485 [Caenorhabditis briggsae]|uniref:ShKT domain-containing protein n=2 Tax=Caenorhabditis briggsae TaxID=6238 RepID=A0AAE9ACD9_CAEBR|nr:hypothetical protein L3Y34_005485 [Caenorhabditis briggsae]
MIKFLIFLSFFIFSVKSGPCLDSILTCPDLKTFCLDESVQSQCPLTCGVCQQDPNLCMDTNLECETFSIQCSQEDYQKQCPKTCGTCKDGSTVVPRTKVPLRTTVIPDCVDHLIECPQFSKPCSDGLALQCPLSCGICNGTTVVPRTTEPQTITVAPTTLMRTTVPPQTTKKPTPTTPKPPCKDASPNCVGWAKNGFCTNTFYPPEKRKEYCAKTCKYC